MEERVSLCLAAGLSVNESAQRTGATPYVCRGLLEDQKWREHRPGIFGQQEPASPQRSTLQACLLGLAGNVDGTKCAVDLPWANDNLRTVEGVRKILRGNSFTVVDTVKLCSAEYICLQITGTGSSGPRMVWLPRGLAQSSCPREEQGELSIRDHLGLHREKARAELLGSEEERRSLVEMASVPFRGGPVVVGSGGVRPTVVFATPLRCAGVAAADCGYESTSVTLVGVQAISANQVNQPLLTLSLQIRSNSTVQGRATECR